MVRTGCHSRPPQAAGSAIPHVPLLYATRGQAPKGAPVNGTPLGLWGGLGAVKARHPTALRAAGLLKGTSRIRRRIRSLKARRPA